MVLKSVFQCVYICLYFFSVCLHTVISRSTRCLCPLSLTVIPVCLSLFHCVLVQFSSAFHSPSRSTTHSSSSPTHTLFRLRFTLEFRTQRMSRRRADASLTPPGRWPIHRPETPLVPSLSFLPSSPLLRLFLRAFIRSSSSLASLISVRWSPKPLKSSEDVRQSASAAREMHS